VVLEQAALLVSIVENGQRFAEEYPKQAPELVLPVRVVVLRSK
jgi:hypothetical protein